MRGRKAIAAACAAAVCLGVMAGCSDKKTDDSKKDTSAAEGTAVTEENAYYNAQPVDTGWEWSNVEIVGGGFVPNIIYNPTEEGLVYCRTDIGGAYKLNKETNRWECITDFIGGDDWNYMGIESIATDPVEPNRVYIAAGTYSSAPGAIFYSDDYGENWGIFELPFGCGGNEVGRGAGERLQVDPNDNSIIYFGSRADGLWKSEDYGRTWAEVTSFPTKGGYTEDGYAQGLTFVAFDKSSGEAGKATQTIFVGAAATKGNYIYRSDDGGQTWTEIENPPAITAGDDRQLLKPCQGEVSSDGHLYTSWSMKIGPNGAMEGAIQKYNIATGEWKEISPETSLTCGYNGISVNPNDPNMIVCTTLDLWAIVDNVFVSFDGGETWGSIWTRDEDKNRVDNYTMDISSSEWLFWQDQLKPGWWMTGVAINPFDPDEIMYGTGATIYGTTNLTKVFDEPVNIEVRAMGVEETAIFDFVSPMPNDENAPDLYSIMGDIYGFKHQDADVAPKEHFGDFKSTDIDCAALDYHIVVRATDEGPGTIYYSTDAADTWEAVETLPEGVKKASGGTVKLSADGGTILYAAGVAGAGVFTSDDFGKSWSLCEGVPSASQIETDKVDPNKFYAAFDGTVYVSTDKGKSWKNLTTLLVSSFTMQACPDVSGDLWINIGSGLFLLDTETGELTNMSENLQDCKAIGFGKAEKDGDYMTIYMLGQANEQGFGVYMSRDKGATWKRINDDAHKWGNVNNVISGDPKTFGRVYISTNGRGIIRGDVKQ
ncbi:cellulose-binding protein [Ruminococcus sp.]|uniref:cellulose-binding protein n=1 Tax=Ruminococcus sp. TaxID=41978 RepID=UPI0025FCF659|nr:cellulose-binding protein [Ruminococcus sp.]MBQ8966815.1 cellulose-binding protein [Ruminococcus sp.]